MTGDNTVLVKMSIVGAMISVSLNITVSLTDNVILGISVVNISMSLLGVGITALVISIVGLGTIVEAGVVTVKRGDADVMLGVVNKDTSLIDGVITVGVSVSSKLKVGTSVNCTVSTVVLASEVKVTRVGVSTSVVSNNGVEVTVTEGIVGTEVSTADKNGRTVVSSMDTTVIVETIMSVNMDGLEITLLCVDKINSLENSVVTNEDADVGETVSNVVSISVNKSELRLVSTGTKDSVNKGMLVGDKTGVPVGENEDTDVGKTVMRVGIVVSTSVNKSELKVVSEVDVSRGMLVDNRIGVVAPNVGKIDVSSPAVVTKDVTILVNSELVVVVMVPVGSNVTEGVITTSVGKELKITRLENGIDIGRVVASITTDVLGNSDVGVETMSEELTKVSVDGDVINRLDSKNTELLVGSTTDKLGVIKDMVTPIVVWSAENEDEIVRKGVIVVGSTENTGEDGNMVTTGMIVVVRMGSEENATADDCTTVGITIPVLAITGSVTAVVRTT